MKKLTNEEIFKRFNEVINKAQNNCFSFDKKTGLVGLGGNFCSDELREIARVLDEVNHGTPEENEIERIKKLNIKGFAFKDIKVYYSDIYEDGYLFSFNIMKDGRDWDFYYGQSDQGAGDWWPNPEYDHLLSPIYAFIPSGFSEESENMYSYSGTNEEAIELLKQCGFTVEKGREF